MFSALCRGPLPLEALTPPPTSSEVSTILGRLPGTPWLMASLMYGCGLRLLECCRLRVKDIDFARLRDHGADGKGIKDRVTMLPARVAASVNATAIIYMESVVQRAFKDALQASGIAKRATCHTLRHYAGSWIMPGGIADRLGMGGSLAA